MTDDDDFFSSVPFNAANAVEPIDSFAQAIANRFGSGDLLTARLVHPTQPTQPSHPLPNTPFANLSILPRPPASSSSSSSLFPSITPANLSDYISNPVTLIVDIRPHAAHSSARVYRAVSLSVPSTLLKRPAFSLEKLCAMLPSPSSRTRFAHWSSSSRIIVYDADSSSIPENSNVCGLLKKFKKEGFAGELAWLRGGFQAVWQERRDLVTTDLPSPEDDEEDQSKLSVAPALRPKHLPKSAFSLSTTTSAAKPSLRGTHRPAANPFFDTIRQNVELSHGITERIPLRLPRRVRRRIADLPFPWLQQIARRAAPRQSHSETESDSSDDLVDNEVDQADVEDGAEALAMQFYRIELAEQRRLLTVMEHHSKESGVSSPQGLSPGPRPCSFPFSITAGVEKGTKNRYTHIWPFEHARVRLHSRTFQPDEDDYINASYVQPLGTTKRYIATQGPLPATFVDFWTLCWEQNVHVIVMLTREVENAMVKCGAYWSNTFYGSLRLRLVSSSPPQTPATDQITETNHGFFFALPTHSADASGAGGSGSKARGNTTIKRVFELSHRDYPAVPPRRITHLQYLEWPDMNVPDDPRGVLALVKEVELAVDNSSPGPSPGTSPGVLPSMEDDSAGLDNTTGIAKFALGSKSPVLLHCSAGVGRTGGFIAVDAVLDSIKTELRKTRHKKNRHAVAEMMDIDEPGNASTAPSRQATNSEMLGTVPLHVSANRRAPGVNGEGQDFVVHVPFAGWTEPMKNLHGHAGVEERMNVDIPSKNLDAGRARPEWGTRRPSTREWAECVSDQIDLGNVFETYGSGAGSSLEPSLPSGQRSAKSIPSVVGSSSRVGHLHRSLSLSPPRQSSSPLSLSQLPPTPNNLSPSSISNVSALNSADDSVGGGSRADSASVSGEDSVRLGSLSGSSGMEGSGLGSKSGATPSSLSAPKSASLSGSARSAASESRSTSGSALGFRAHLPESSVTSLSDTSGSSGEVHARSKVLVQPPLPLRQPSARRIEDNSPPSWGREAMMDVDMDFLPRSSSVPLGGPARLSEVDGVGTSAVHPHASVAHELHHRISTSPAASLSTPSLSIPGGLSSFLSRERAADMFAMSRSTSKSSSSSEFGYHISSTPLSCVQSTSNYDELSNMANPPPLSGHLSRRSSNPPSHGSPIALDANDVGSGNLGDIEPSDPGSRSSLSIGTNQHRSGGEGEDNRGGGHGSCDRKAGVNTNSSTEKGMAAVGILNSMLSSQSAKLDPSAPIPSASQCDEAPLNDALASEGGDQRAAGHSMIDYKLPRALHTDLSPPLLSSFDDPIWTVVQDMREQRMSLCQSLRQYVFVYAAVVEGALMVVDEEREMWCTGSDGSPVLESGMGGDGGAYFTGRSAVRKPDSCRDLQRIMTTAVPGFFSSGITSAGSSVSGGRGPPTSVSSSSVPLSSPSKGKRGASPTELLKENKCGGVSLAKRPSMKRRPGSSDNKRLTFDPSAEAAGILGGVGGIYGRPTQSAGSVAKSMVTTTGGPMTPEKGNVN